MRITVATAISMSLLALMLFLLMGCTTEFLEKHTALISPDVNHDKTISLNLERIATSLEKIAVVMEKTTIEEREICE